MSNDNVTTAAVSSETVSAHDVARSKVQGKVNAMLDSIETALKYWNSIGEQHGSTELADVLENAHGVPAALALGLVKTFFDNHPTLEAVRGPNGGIKPRGLSKKNGKEKVKRVAKPTPTVPGVNAAATDSEIDLSDDSEDA